MDKRGIFRALCADFIPANAMVNGYSISEDSAEWREYDIPDLFFKIEYREDKVNGDSLYFLISKDMESWRSVCQFWSDYTYREVWISIKVTAMAIERILKLKE